MFDQAPAHNIIIQIFVETGFLACLVFIFFVYYALQKGFVKKDNSFAIAGLAYFVAAQFHPVFTNHYELSAFFFLYLGLVLMKKSKNKLQLILKMKVFKIILICLTLILGSILFTQKRSTKNWQFYTKNSIGANNNLNIYDNLIFDEQTILFNSQDKKTYSLDVASGHINWIFQAQNYSPYPPIIYNQQVFLANFDGNIYSLEKKTGYKIWQFSTEDQAQPDTPVVHSLYNQLVFFGSRNGTLYALK
jgi:hypothetical protein